MSAHAQLTDGLAALRAYCVVHMPADIAQAMERTDIALAVSGIVDRALKARRLAPDFALPDQGMNGGDWVLPIPATYVIAP